MSVIVTSPTKVDPVALLIEASGGSKSTKFKRKIGAELETFLRKGGKLVDASHFIASHPKHQGELRKQQVEFGASPIELGGRCFSDMLRQEERFYQLIRDDGYSPYPAAVYSDRLENLSRAEVSSYSPRYLEFWGVYPSRVKGAKVFGKEVKTIAPLFGQSSHQYHLGVTPEEIPHALNVGYAVSAPALAPFVSGGRFDGMDRGYACVRPEIWRRLFPGRTGVSARGSWVSSLKEHLELINGFSDWVNPEVSHADKIEGDQGLLQKLRDFNLKASTLWPDVRLKWFIVDDEEVQYTIEARHQGASTLLDNVSGLAFWTGLMRYFMENFEQEEFTEKFGEHRFVEENFMSVAKSGFDAKILWIGKEAQVRVSVKELLLNELIPCAKTGLESSGVSPEEIKYFLDPVTRTVETGRTLGSWVKRTAKQHSKKGALRIDQILMESFQENFDTGLPIYQWD